MLAMVPLGAGRRPRGWWRRGCNPKQDDAVREIIAAFEQMTGKQSELSYASTLAKTGLSRLRRALGRSHAMPCIPGKT
jgi:hypothetical protein